MPQNNKGHIQTTYCQHHTQWARTESVSFKIMDKIRCLLSPLLFNIVLEVLVTVIRQEEEIKDIQMVREVGSKIAIICRQQYSVHREPYRVHPKLLNLVNEFGKVVGYKVNIQKLMTFLFTNNELSEAMKEVPFTTATTTITKST